MNKEALDAVLKAFEKLVEVELRTTDPARFQRIGKICVQAHTIAKMGNLRVAGVMDEVDLANDINGGLVDAEFGGQFPMNAPGRRLRAIGGFVGGEHVDQVDIFREVLALAQPVVKSFMAKTQRQEVDRLLDLRDRLVEAGRPTDAIDRQIDEAQIDKAARPETVVAEAVSVENVDA